MAQTEEQKTAKALMRGVSSLTFDPYAFAFVITNEDPLVQARVMQAFIAFVMQMADKIHTDDLTEHNADAVIMAARVRDVLEVYNES